MTEDNIWKVGTCSKCGKEGKIVAQTQPKVNEYGISPAYKLCKECSELELNK